METTEKCLLQENHELIVNNVSVKESEVLIHLLESGTLTDHECEDIKGKKTVFWQFSKNMVDSGIVNNLLYKTPLDCLFY